MDEAFVAQTKSRILDAHAQETRRQEVIRAAIKEFVATVQTAADELTEGIRQAAGIQAPVTACVTEGSVVLSVNGESKTLCNLKYHGGREGRKELPWFHCGPTVEEHKEAYDLSLGAIRGCLLWAAEIQAGELLDWVVKRSQKRPTP